MNYGLSLFAKSFLQLPNNIGKIIRWAETSVCENIRHNVSALLFCTNILNGQPF